MVSFNYKLSEENVFCKQASNPTIIGLFIYNGVLPKNTKHSFRWKGRNNEQGVHCCGHDDLIYSESSGECGKCSGGGPNRLIDESVLCHCVATRISAKKLLQQLTFSVLRTLYWSHCSACYNHDWIETIRWSIFRTINSPPSFVSVFLEIS